MIPTLQVTTGSPVGAAAAADFDRVLAPGSPLAQLYDTLLALIADTTTEHYVPRTWAAGNHDFQVTRGLLGVSL
jgi:hypothetical protein